LQHAAQAHTRRAVGDLGLQPSQTNRGAQPKTKKKYGKKQKTKESQISSCATVRHGIGGEMVRPWNSWQGVVMT